MVVHGGPRAQLRTAPAGASQGLREDTLLVFLLSFNIKRRTKPKVDGGELVTSSQKSVHKRLTANSVYQKLF